jgi:hypothetical protein
MNPLGDCPRGTFDPPQRTGETVVSGWLIVFR